MRFEENDTISNALNDFIIQVSNLLKKRLDKIILYGSYARGDFDENSDLDLMILTNLNDDELIEYRMKIREIACDIEEEYDIIISPIVKNSEKYDSRINIIPYYMNIAKEGLVINER